MRLPKSASGHPSSLSPSSGTCGTCHTLDQLERLKPNGLAAPVHPQPSKTLTPKAFQLWDTWSSLPSQERKATLKPLNNLTLLQTPPKTCNSDTVTLSVLGIQELISHRLAHIFICCVKHKHSNTLLRCTSKLPFLPLPLTADSPRCRPALPRHRCTACRKKDSTSLALRAASRCENKPMVRRRDEERGRRREGRRKEGGRGEVCYVLQFRLWGLVCGSFMWQKPINHSWSLTGPLLQTEAHTLTPTHTYKHAWAPTRPCLRPCCLIHRGARPNFTQTCPMTTPSPHAHVHTIKPSSHPSPIRPSLSPSISPSPRVDKRWQLLMSHQICFYFPFRLAAVEREHNLNITPKKINWGWNAT